MVRHNSATLPFNSRVTASLSCRVWTRTLEPSFTDRFTSQSLFAGGGFGGAAGSFFDTSHDVGFGFDPDARAHGVHASAAPCLLPLQRGRRRKPS